MDDKKKEHDEVTIHIDKKQYKSPNPTTGAALYLLGGVDASKYDLFLEVPGPKDDQPIANDQARVELKNGAHLYTAQKNLNPGSPWRR
jgi:hypothetical protein